MTFTYAGPTSPLGEVRFKLGDTDDAQALFTDEEIAYELGAADGSVLRAAAALCDVMATRTAGDIDFDALEQKSFKQSQATRGWAARARELREQADREDGGNGLAVVSVRRRDSYSDRAECLARTGRAPVACCEPDEPPTTCP